MAWTIGTADESADAAPTRPRLQSPLFLIGTLGLLVGLSAVIAGVAHAGSGTLAFLGLVWIAGGVAGHRAARPPKDGPSFSIATLAPGPVEVVGRVVPPKKALLSPLTSTKCSYYDYKIWLLDDATGERTLVDERSMLSDFWLKDITGHIWVESEGIDIAVPAQLDEDLRTYDQTPRAVGERLVKLGVDPFVEPGVRRPILVQETRLDPGDNMLMRGEVVRRDDGQLVLRKGSVPLRIERWSRPTFIAVVPTGAKLSLWLGVVALLGGLAGLLA